MSKKSIICHSQLPKHGGLGNKIFVWSYGLIFSKINDCEHYTSGWASFHPGPLLRGEKSMRFYKGYFKKQTLKKRIVFFYLRHTYQQVEVPIDEIAEKKEATTKVCYSLTKIPKDWHTCYQPLQPYSTLIRKKLFSNITTKITNRLNKYKPPIIAAHIRMGDFRKTDSEKELNQNSVAQRTPLHFFVETIKQLRELCGYELPVTVFSDGNDHELKKVLNLNEVQRAEDDLDIVHLLRLSQSNILICSEGSTFSGWSAFLSEGIIIRNPKVFQNKIRAPKINQLHYEGIMPTDIKSCPPLLSKGLQKLKTTFTSSKP